MELFTPFLIGCFGGFAAEVLVWHKRRTETFVPPGWMYFGVTIFMILIGGVMAAGYTYDGRQLGFILAAHIGATSPLIVGTWVKEPPPVND